MTETNSNGQLFKQGCQNHKLQAMGSVSNIYCIHCVLSMVQAFKAVPKQELSEPEFMAFGFKN